MCSVVSLATECENECLAKLFRSTGCHSILPVPWLILETGCSSTHISSTTTTQSSWKSRIESRNHGKTQTIDPT